jgi:serine/threonine protein kinase
MQVMKDAGDSGNVPRAADSDSGALAALRPELEIVRPLGRGSTSDVYLAREPLLQRLVALKVLRPELAADEVVRKRFAREAQSAARITHPHVTAVYRVGQLTGDVPYIVMEYVDGRTVAQIIAAQGPFGPAEARAVLASVAAALAAAHERGVVHRDVRPSNVYVENRTGRAVLGDFGIAALLASGAESATRLTAAGIRLGDTRYMSPEQLRGEAVTEQSDIYSFGLLAYEVLTGGSPYDAKTPAQLMIAHMTLDPRPLRALLPDANAAWLPVLERCLAKDPDRRPRARELAAALAAPTGTMAALAPAPRGSLQYFLDEIRRRRMYQVLGGYAAFAIALLGIAQAINEAFETRDSYRFLVVIILAGFPAALVLGWLYDISATGIQRTRSTVATRRSNVIKWAGLGLSIAIAALAGWLLLGRS